MFRFVLPLAAAGALSVAALSTPVSAAPALPTHVTNDDGGLTQVRYHRRHYRRHRMMSRRASPSNSGNARNPSRPVSQQNQGQTSGGPRY